MTPAPLHEQQCAQRAKEFEEQSNSPVMQPAGASPARSPQLTPPHRSQRSLVTNSLLSNSVLSFGIHLYFWPPQQAAGINPPFNHLQCDRVLCFILISLLANSSECHLIPLYRGVTDCSV